MDRIQLNKKIKKLEFKGKNLSDIKDLLKECDVEDRFFYYLFKIDCTKDLKRKQFFLNKAISVSKDLDWLKGWPEDSKIFWAFEAGAWVFNIPKSVRTFVQNQLLKTVPQGLNLSLGSGSCPYIPGSVLLDLSKDMLSVPPASKYDKRVVFDLDNSNLPFCDNSFDSVSMVFLLNYIKHPNKVLSEVRRVLKPDGKLFIVQSAKPLNILYQLQEKQFFDKDKLQTLLENSGFKFDIHNKKSDNTELVFADCY